MVARGGVGVRRGEQIVVVPFKDTDKVDFSEVSGPRPDVLTSDEGRPYVFAEQAGHLLRKAYQRHTAIFQKLSIDPQITSVQLYAMCAIAEEGPCSLTTLGRATAVDPATTRGVVERLRERGYVALAADPEDKRRVKVSLTEKGVECVQRMIEPAQEVTRETLKGLSVAEQVALSYLLKKISDQN
ncbi:MAG: MarR family transcriptional regulator BpsR [Acuticoccus sp.]